MNILTRKHILKKLILNEEESIDYDSFFKKQVIVLDTFNSLKRFGTLYDLLIDLLNEQISIKEAKKTKCDDKTKSMSYQVLLHQNILLKIKVEVP